MLQKVYNANILVNLQDLSFTFYKIDLLLKYQNREFKHFQTNRRSFLQQIDKIFQLNALLFNTLFKTRQVINKIIIKRERSRRHPTKNAWLHI